MSAIHTGYQSQMISGSNGNNPQEKMNKIQLPVYKYLDIDSTYRNRIDYPDPNSFVVRNSSSSNVASSNLVAYNLPFYSFPISQLYVGTTFTPLTFQNFGNNNLVLDTRETTTVPNFYADYFLESIAPTTAAPTPLQYSTVQYATIASYDDTTQTVVLTSNLSTATTVNGTNYIIRKNKPSFIGNITAINTAGSVFTISSTFGSVPNDSNSVYYIRVRKSGTASLDNRIVQVTISPSTNQITLNSPLFLQVNDSIEIVGPGQNIITSLRYASGGSQSIQGGDYELELLWLSVPNQVLDVGYGGTLDRYPYIYCSLYTGITNTTQQVLYSNNPYTSKVLFKVPVNEYFGDTSFITLKDSKAKQTIYFDPSQDLFFELTLPDGTVISFNEFDNMPPYPPNPFLQINLLVSMKKI